MCWNLTASLLITLIGLIFTVYLIVKKKDNFLWIPAGYFTLMELLQTMSYFYLGKCDLPINQILTLLSYIHISFQPFFINMLSMHFIPQKVRNKIKGYVFGVCFASTILMLIKIYPFIWAGSCKVGSTLCATNLCTISGNWHLGWNIPLNSISWLLFLGYSFPAFILPLIYGSWRLTGYHFVLGPTLAYLLTDNLNEWPAIWCLLSIAFLLAILIKPIYNNLHVKKWYFWKYFFRK